MENTYFNQAKKELIDVSKIKNNKLESSDFRLLHNFVFYFNCDTDKNDIDFYIENNFETLKNSFKTINKVFINVNNLSVNASDIEALKYYFPAFRGDNTIFNPTQSLLDYLNYSGTIQNGVIIHADDNSHEKQVSIIELTHSSTKENYKLFFESLANHLVSNIGYFFEKVKIDYQFSGLCSPIIVEYDENEDVDDETKTQVQNVLDKLNEIRDNGNFIALLPILEKHLKDQEQKNIKISRIRIDQDYKIWLTDYGLEVKMSHLTKSLYFLFLAMKHGIDLNEIIKYRKYLINIYMGVSNQDNYEKMIKSIDLLLNDRNAIYVHISRIKSIFLKLLHEDKAKNFYITGDKNKPKRINIKRELTNINRFLDDWEIDPEKYAPVYEEFYLNPNNYSRED